MKKFIAISVMFLLPVALLLSCSYEGTYDDGFADGYDLGYDDGFADGYDLGYDEARIEFEDDYAKGFTEGENTLAGEIDWVSVEIRNEYGIYPEDAIYILQNYMFDPDSVSYTEMCDAIYAIRKYYFDVNNLIQD